MVSPRLLLDTHILVRWLQDRKKLTRQQVRGMESSVRNRAPFAFSAVSLLEIAMLVGDNRLALRTSLDQVFAQIRADPEFQLMPMTFEIALDASRLGILRDPMDRAITATARIHSLTLVTAEQRICDSSLVPVLS